ncbi:hypothetical protein CYMTET_55065 [Cymbomonas tetramitiformis]|uniref:Uncharacterized protein n=1 Tax=Cymbomonas tetramitiformis TaxID=36881 RepID=A0AAE0BF47_9CHLO|nr:hypothetical protein CYMTET_55065 [Cymbomonas tetramitiformis]|eukprot:gene316-576_t
MNTLALGSDVTDGFLKSLTSDDASAIVSNNATGNLLELFVSERTSKLQKVLPRIVNDEARSTKDFYSLAVMVYQLITDDPDCLWWFREEIKKAAKLVLTFVKMYDAGLQDMLPPDKLKSLLADTVNELKELTEEIMKVHTKYMSFNDERISDLDTSVKRCRSELLACEEEVEVDCGNVLTLHLQTKEAKKNLEEARIQGELQYNTEVGGTFGNDLRLILMYGSFSIINVIHTSDLLLETHYLSPYYKPAAETSTDSDVKNRIYKWFIGIVKKQEFSWLDCISDKGKPAADLLAANFTGLFYVWGYEVLHDQLAVMEELENGHQRIDQNLGMLCERLCAKTQDIITHDFLPELLEMVTHSFDLDDKWQKDARKAAEEAASNYLTKNLAEIVRKNVGNCLQFTRDTCTAIRDGSLGLASTITDLRVCYTLKKDHNYKADLVKTELKIVYHSTEAIRNSPVYGKTFQQRYDAKHDGFDDLNHSRLDLILSLLNLGKMKNANKERKIDRIRNYYMRACKFTCMREVHLDPPSEDNGGEALKIGDVYQYAKINGASKKTKYVEYEKYANTDRAKRQLRLSWNNHIQRNQTVFDKAFDRIEESDEKMFQQIHEKLDEWLGA